MTTRWRNIFRDGPKEFEVTESGVNHYSLLKIDGEVIMTIAEGPATSDGGFNVGVGASVSVSDVSGNVQVGKNKNVSFRKPIILFKENNKAGLKPIDAIAEIKAHLPEAQKNESIKTNINDLTENNMVSFDTGQNIAVGSSVLQVGMNDTVSVIRSPNITEDDKKLLQLFLRFVVESLLVKEGTYRANIMLYDLSIHRLKIKSYYNMEGYTDTNIELKLDEGGAGKALQNDTIQKVDLMVQKHEEYRVHPQIIWKEMKSIYSIPIHDSNGNILGILNLDSNQRLPDTRFYDDSKFDHSMGLATDIIGKYLEKKS